MSKKTVLILAVVFLAASSLPEGEGRFNSRFAKVQDYNQCTAFQLVVRCVLGLERLRRGNAGRAGLFWRFIVRES